MLSLMDYSKLLRLETCKLYLMFLMLEQSCFYIIVYEFKFAKFCWIINNNNNIIYTNIILIFIKAKYVF